MPIATKAPGWGVELSPADFIREFVWRVRSTPELQREVALEMGDLAQELYGRTVRTWKRKPEFKMVYEERGGEVLVHVGTDSDIYKWIDEGTGPRDIVPKKPGGVLVFRSTYKARTTPGRLASGRKWVGGRLIFTKRVTAHRIKPRGFTAAVYREVQVKGRARLVEAVKRWTRKLREAGR